MFYAPLIVFSLCLSRCLSKTLGGSEKTIIWACQFSLLPYTFDCSDPSFWGCSCTYPPKIASIAACVNDYDPVFFNRSIEVLSTYCLQYGKISQSEEMIHKMYTDNLPYLIDTNKNETDLNGIKIRNPVLPSRIAVKEYKQSYDSYYANFDDSPSYGMILNYYWIIVLIIFTMIRFAKTLKVYRFLAKRSSVISHLHRMVSLPAFFGSWNPLHTYPLRFRIFTFEVTSLIPTRIESILILIYTSLNLYYLSSHYVFYSESRLFTDFKIQQIKYIADRSGIIAFTQLPSIFLFMQRNTLLTSLTGFEYNSLIQFHKWISRLMTFNAIVHSLAYFAYASLRGSWKSNMLEAYWNWGIIATLVCCLLVIYSVHCFRSSQYELFFQLHCIFGAIFLVSCLYHCIQFGYLEYLAVSGIIWIGERVLRLIKILRFGIKKCRIELVQSDETRSFKITIDRPPNNRVYPGCYVYLSFLDRRLNWWESHPFSICDSILHENEITIFVKVKEGMTNDIYELLTVSLTGRLNLTVAVESCYGNGGQFSESFSNHLLLAGGNGLPGLLYHMVKSIQNGQHTEKNLKLVWIVRSWNDLSLFETELLQLNSLLDTFIEGPVVEIYVTRSLETEAKWISRLNHFNFMMNRPDLEKSILGFTYEIMSNDKEDTSVMVMSCGPERFCDEIRNIICKVERDGVHIEYIEELQVW